MRATGCIAYIIGLRVSARANLRHHRFIGHFHTAHDTARRNIHSPRSLRTDNAIPASSTLGPFSIRIDRNLHQRKRQLRLQLARLEIDHDELLLGRIHEINTAWLEQKLILDPLFDYPSEIRRFKLDYINPVF